MADEDIKIELSNIQKNNINMEFLSKASSIPSNKRGYLNDIRKLSQLSSDNDTKRIVRRGYDILRYHRLANGKKVSRKIN